MPPFLTHSQPQTQIRLQLRSAGLITEHVPKAWNSWSPAVKVLPSQPAHLLCWRYCLSSSLLVSALSWGGRRSSWGHSHRLQTLLSQAGAVSAELGRWSPSLESEEKGINFKAPCYHLPSCVAALTWTWKVSRGEGRGEEREGGEEEGEYNGCPAQFSNESPQNPVWQSLGDKREGWRNARKSREKNVSLSGSEKNVWLGKGLRRLCHSPAGKLGSFCQPLWITSLSEERIMNVIDPNNRFSHAEF